MKNYKSLIVIALVLALSVAGCAKKTDDSGKNIGILALLLSLGKSGGSSCLQIDNDSITNVYGDNGSTSFLRCGTSLQNSYNKVTDFGYVSNSSDGSSQTLYINKDGKRSQNVSITLSGASISDFVYSKKTGKLAQRIDDFGFGPSIASYYYDATGNLTAVTTTSGSGTYYAYKDGRVSSVNSVRSGSLNSQTTYSLQGGKSIFVFASPFGSAYASVSKDSSAAFGTDISGNQTTYDLANNTNQSVSSNGLSFTKYTKLASDVSASVSSTVDSSSTPFTNGVAGTVSTSKTVKTLTLGTKSVASTVQNDSTTSPSTTATTSKATPVFDTTKNQLTSVSLPDSTGSENISVSPFFAASTITARKTSYEYDATTGKVIKSTTVSTTSPTTGTAFTAYTSTSIVEYAYSADTGLLSGYTTTSSTTKSGDVASKTISVITYDGENFQITGIKGTNTATTSTQVTTTTLAYTGGQITSYKYRSVYTPTTGTGYCQGSFNGDNDYTYTNGLISKITNTSVTSSFTSTTCTTGTASSNSYEYSGNSLTKASSTVGATTTTPLTVTVNDVGLPTTVVTDNSSATFTSKTTTNYTYNKDNGYLPTGSSFTRVNGLVASPTTTTGTSTYTYNAAGLLTSIAGTGDKSTSAFTFAYDTVLPTQIASLDSTVTDSSSGTAIKTVSNQKFTVAAGYPSNLVTTTKVSDKLVYSKTDTYTWDTSKGYMTKLVSASLYGTDANANGTLEDTELNGTSAKSSSTTSYAVQ